MRILHGDVEIGVLRQHALSEGATLDLDGHRYELGRTGAMHGDYELRDGGSLVAAATKPSALRSRFAVRFDGRDFELGPTGLMAQTFELRANGDVIGRIERDGAMTSRASMHLPADWPTAVQVFVTWLVQLMWERASAVVV
jgi:hypothetical protein